MDLIHMYLLEIIFMAALPLLLGVGISIYAWRSVRHRVLFSIICIITFSGLGSIAYPIAVRLLNPSMDGPLTFPSAGFNVLAATAVCAAAIGFPIALRLRNILRAT